MYQKAKKEETPKEYLSQLQKIDIIINQKIKEKERLRDSLFSISPLLLSEDKVMGGKVINKASFVKVLERIMELEEEIDEEVDSYIDKKHQIINQIQMLSNTNYIEILYKRYVEYKGLKQVAIEMKYDYDYIRRLHGQALQAFEKEDTLTHKKTH